MLLNCSAYEKNGSSKNSADKEKGKLYKNILSADTAVFVGQFSFRYSKRFFYHIVAAAFFWKYGVFPDNEISGFKKLAFRTFDLDHSSFTALKHCFLLWLSLHTVFYYKVLLPIENEYYSKGITRKDNKSAKYGKNKSYRIKTQREKSLYMSIDKTAAVIMAGGLGERLRPITDTVPKPIVPIGDGMAITGALRMLSRVGIKRAYVTVRYKCEDIIKKLGEEAFGVSLSYLIEKEGLGTAGGVREAYRKIREENDVDEIAVLSGDAVSDFDLSPLLSLHRLKGSAVTMFLARSNEPWRYGVVSTDSDGRVLKFSEKPKDANVGDTVNTGIYIISKRVIEMIPPGEYDFGRELFPLMLRCGERIYGKVGEGYWCDVGTPESYVKCCNDAVLGKINGYGGNVDGSGAIISENSRIGKGSVMTGAIVHEGVSIGEDVRAKNAVFCRGVSVGCRVTVGEGAVIGAGSYIGDGIRIPDGAKIAPRSRIESGVPVFAENL